MSQGPRVGFAVRQAVSGNDNDKGIGQPDSREHGINGPIGLFGHSPITNPGRGGPVDHYRHARKGRVLGGRL